MCKTNTNFAFGYQLRQAAGQYWLLNMEQPGIPYQGPIMLNEMGAEIWRRLAGGKTKEDIVKELGAEYDVPTGEIEEDVQLFYKQLVSQGIITEG